MYDPRCYDLAEDFLEDEPLLNRESYRKQLAQEIQTAIESWIIAARKDAEPPDPPGFEGGFADNH